MKKWVVAVAILALLVAHQDYWQWNRTELVYDIVPFNMAYHIVLSIVTATVWLLVCTFCWPRQVEEVDFGDDAEAPGDAS